MKQRARAIGLATELGITLGVTAAGLVVLGLWLGRWLDARLGTSPFATMLLLLAAAIAGQIAIYRLAIRATRRLSAGAHSVLNSREVLSALGLSLRVLALMSLPALAGLALGTWMHHLLGSGIWVTALLALGGLVGGSISSLRVARSRGLGTDQEGDRACSNANEG